MFDKFCKKRQITPPPYLDTVEDLGNMFLVRLKGSINIEALQRNREKMTAVIEQLDLYSKNVIVDFKAVTETDSATIAALLDRFIAIEKYNNKIGLFNIPEHLTKLIDVLRVSHNFITYPDEAKAIAEHK